MAVEDNERLIEKLTETHSGTRARLEGIDLEIGT